MKMLNARSALFAVIASATAFSANVVASDEWVELGQSDNGIRFAVVKDTPISGAGVFTGRQRLTMPYPVKCADMEQLKVSDPEFYARCDQAMSTGVSVWIQHTQVDCQRKMVRGLYEEYINYKGESLGDEQLNEVWGPPAAGGFGVYLLNQYCGTP